jgi:hypothetical protein
MHPRLPHLRNRFLIARTLMALGAAPAAAGPNGGERRCEIQFDVPRWARFSHRKEEAPELGRKANTTSIIL